MSDNTQATEPTPDDEDEDYVPIQLPEPPVDEEARRALREQQEDREIQREIVLDRLAAAYADLDEAEAASDEKAVAEVRARIQSLIAERDRL